MKVYVDPACNINYSSFYIVGLRNIFGYRNIVFTSKYFKGLTYKNNTHILAFVIDNKRYVIDYADSNQIFYDEFLDWADIYGKVNYRTEFIPSTYGFKVCKVGANFSIACYGTNRYVAVFWCLKHYLQCFRRLKHSFLSFLSPYLCAYKRRILPMTLTKIGSKHIFFVSRYWNGQDETNKIRINFIRACKRLDKEGIICFVGGMVPDELQHDCPKDVLLESEIPYKEYMEGIQNSLLVFNTPAYYYCHGWKLPEFLSQGKIILSTPFVNELPREMEHGKHIFYTESDEDSMYNSIKRIVLDINVQKQLLEGSISYWKLYANPKACMNLFLQDATRIVP